jgi:uncharacterized protein
MEENTLDVSRQQETVIQDVTGQQAAIKNFMATVFSWMAAALILSGTAAWLFGTTNLVTYLVSYDGLTTLGNVVLFAPLGFVLLMSFGYNRLSYPVLVFLFATYSIITGMSLSFIFLIYELGSIIQVFGIAAAMFGIMAISGYRTSTDLTKFGSIMMMGLIGMIVASLINYFMQSESMSYLLSFVGVLVFTGLTAYDVQKLKRIAAGEGLDGTESAGKLAIMGALNLYLDFINLFLSLLRLFGSRK